jgi:hypothetical protein
VAAPTPVVAGTRRGAQVGQLVAATVGNREQMVDIGGGCPALPASAAISGGPMGKPWAKAPLPQPVPIGSNREPAASVFGSAMRNSAAAAKSADHRHRVRIPVAVPLDPHSHAGFLVLGPSLDQWLDQ